MEQVLDEDMNGDAGDGYRERRKPSVTHRILPAPPPPESSRPPPQPSSRLGRGIAGWRRFTPGLAAKILIGLCLGIAFGLALHRAPALRDTAIPHFLEPAGEIFIRLIKMIVVPIVFTSMVIGIAGIADMRALRWVGIKTIIYFEVVTSLAIILGLCLGNLAEPGAHAPIAAMAHNAASLVPRAVSGVPLTLPPPVSPHGGVMHLILAVVPENILASMGRGDLLPVIFFAVLFGFGLQSVKDEYRRVVLSLFQGISEAMFRVTDAVMRCAPLGVFALMTVTVANVGWSSLMPLVKLVALAYASMLLFACGVLGLAAHLSDLNIFTLMRVVKSELIIAFSTSSSVSVLPQIMKKMEDFGAPKSIATFVVSTGYSFNLSGASLYLGIGTLFVAQTYGIHLGIVDQCLLFLTMAITSKGGGGVPGIMPIILLLTLEQAGLPIEGLAFIAGVDRIIDMGRTALNVLGNALAPLVIAKWEGRYDAEKAAAYIQTLP